jgi:hypothetical protein
MNQVVIFKNCTAKWENGMPIALGELRFPRHQTPQHQACSSIAGIAQPQRVRRPPAWSGGAVGARRRRQARRERRARARKTFQLDSWTPSLNPLCTATGNPENWLVSYITKPLIIIQMLNQK